jgi:hypothetical protein
MSARAWVAIVVGSGFVVGSIVWLIVSPGALAASVLSVGLVILLISAASRLLRLTDPEVDVPDELRVGEPFSMRYRQRWKRASKVSRIRFELKFQETVYYSTTDAAGRTYRAALFHDDVIQGFTVAGRRFKRGQTINQRCAFQIPPNGMHTFYSSNHRIEWYVTARIEMPWWRDHSWWQQLTVLPELVVTDG